MEMETSKNAATEEGRKKEGGKKGQRERERAREIRGTRKTRNKKGFLHDNS